MHGHARGRCCQPACAPLCSGDDVRRVAASSAIAFGFLMGGVALTVDARELALHSSIRRLLNEQCDGFLIDSIGPACRHDPLLSRAVLVEDASRDGDFVSLRVEIVAVQLGGVWHAVEGGVTISVNGTAEEERVAEWRAGRTLEAPVTYRRPARYLNDGVPDFERDLALAGTTLLGTIKSGLLIDVVREGGYWAEVSADIRSHVRHAVARWIEPHDPISAAIASAVLIGDRTGLPDETREALQAAGTYHVIAISGGNIAILAAAATLLLSVVAVRGRSAAIVAIAVLSGYALVITAGPSVWRATWMAILYFAARAVDHRSGAWQSSSVAAALMIVARPLDVRDAGFILTFGATLALLEGVRIGARLRPRIGALSWVAASVVASLAIEIALLPVSATLFSRVTGAGLVLNLLAVPLMGVVQIAALVATLADRFPAVAGPAGWISHVAAQALVGSANLVTLAPWSTARVPSPPAGVVAAYYLALAAMIFWKSRLPRVIAAVALVAMTLVITGALDPLPTRPPVLRAEAAIDDVRCRAGGVDSHRKTAWSHDAGRYRRSAVRWGSRRWLPCAGAGPVGEGHQIPRHAAHHPWRSRSSWWRTGCARRFRSASSMDGRGRSQSSSDVGCARRRGSSGDARRVQAKRRGRRG